MKYLDKLAIDPVNNRGDVIAKRYILGCRTFDPYQ